MLFLAASLWGPYKDIWQAVFNAIWKKQPEAVHLLDQILKKHKPDFISLFRNPVNALLFGVCGRAYTVLVSINSVLYGNCSRRAVQIELISACIR